MSPYKYIQSEPGLWTVGTGTPGKDWDAESDHESAESAAERVSALNGGSDLATTHANSKLRQERAKLLDELAQARATLAQQAAQIAALTKALNNWMGFVAKHFVIVEVHLWELWHKDIEDNLAESRAALALVKTPDHSDHAALAAAFGPLTDAQAQSLTDHFAATERLDAAERQAESEYSHSDDAHSEYR